MPLDAICLRAVLNELRPKLIGARIEALFAAMMEEDHAI